MSHRTVTVWTANLRARSIDLDTVRLFKPHWMGGISSYGLVLSAGIITERPEFDPLCKLVPFEDGLMRISIEEWITRNLTGLRTSLALFNNCRPRLGYVYWSVADDFWFIEARKSGFADQIHFFQLTQEEARTWLEANRFEDPRLLVSDSQEGVCLLGEQPALGNLDLGTRPISSHSPKVGKKLNRPSVTEIECYRYKHIKGTETDQVGIAIKVYGDRSKQGQVSRALKRVAEWIEAGNVLPDLSECSHRLKAGASI